MSDWFTVAFVAFVVALIAYQAGHYMGFWDGFDDALEARETENDSRNV